jgi:hypothetical protein
MRVPQLLSPEYIKKSAELTVTERLEEWYGFDTPPKK